MNALLFGETAWPEIAEHLWEVPIDLVYILDEFGNIHLRPSRSAKLLRDSTSQNTNFYGKWVHFEEILTEKLDKSLIFTK